MRAPEFWAEGPSPASSLLAPAALLYRIGAGLRRRLIRPWRAPVPVVCVGGVVAGGSGKTPAALALAARLVRAGRQVHFLSRGYRGGLSRGPGPVRVDTARHSAPEVGDEPLLLARLAPTWAGRDRAACARAAIEDGAEALVMDDGFQNPSLVKDISILVVDGIYGFGNRRLLPAGPLREPLGPALRRADAVILVGENSAGATASLPPRLPLLRARLVPGPEGAGLKGRDVVAFAGIGRPEKFFRGLEALGARLVSRHAFPDHHAFRREEIEKLRAEAEEYRALLVTTAKDAVRLPEDLRAGVRVLRVTLEFRDEAALAALLAPILRPD